MEYNYAITMTNDSEKVASWVGRYDNALDAVNDFNKFNDFGDAERYRIINLSEPSGKMHTKVFYRDGKVSVK